MNRRAFVTGLGAVLAAPLGAEAQPGRSKPRKTPKVALLYVGTPEAEISGANPKNPAAKNFLEGLRECGWIDGQNIAIERRSAPGDPDRYLPLIQEMLSLKVDVLVISGAPKFVIAAQQATRTTPIVMAGLAGDPLKLGLANSYARLGGNVTGSTFTAAAGLTGKQLELLKEIAPATSRAAFIGMTADSATESAARALGVAIVQVPFDNARPTEALSIVVQNKVNALVVAAVSVWAHRGAVIDFAAKQRLPAVYAINECVMAGGLMSYSAPYSAIFRRAALYVDKILKGAKPGDLPIEQPTKFELWINKRTAKALGLTIPHRSCCGRTR
jgi:putative ABC transport system substrate-binding protein